MSTSVKNSSSSDDARELRHDIEQTRAEMTATVAAIEHRLDPSELRNKAAVELEHVEVKVKEALRAGLEEARAMVKEDLTIAKASVKEELTLAKAAVKQDFLEAKASVKNDINEAFENAKTSVRKATLGRVEDLATQAGDAMNDSRETLIETMKLNPIPTAIVGVGLAWLLMNRSSAGRRRQNGGVGNGYPNQGGWVGAQAQYDNGVRQAGHLATDVAHRAGAIAGQFVERAEHLAGGVAQGVSRATTQVGEGLGGAATAVNHAMHDARDVVNSAAHQGFEAASTGLHQTTDAAGRLIHQTTDAAGRLVHQVGDGMTHFGQSAQHLAGSAYGGARNGVVRAEHGFESILESNPLAVGAAVALVGAAIGFALPRTSREDALMGATRDGVVEKAANYAQEATQSLEHLAASVGTSAKQAVQGA